MMDENVMLEAEEYEEVEEVESEQEEDGMEFTDTGANEDEAADHPTDSENDENGDDAVEEVAEGKSTMQAEKRREREAKEEAIRKKIEQESYRKGIVDAVGGVNPYTGEKIQDEADIDEYLLMKKLEKEGKDPIEDYAAAVKGEKREKAEKAKAESKRVEELTEFADKYPNVDVSALLQDSKFGKFAGKRVQHESLAEVYADYLEFTGNESAEIEKKAAVKAKTAEMKKKASPGSLVGNGDAAKVSYADMSEKDFERKLARVLRGEENI
jgi:hypothetical protein